MFSVKGRITMQELHPSVTELLMPAELQEKYMKQHCVTLGDGGYRIELDPLSNRLKIISHGSHYAYLGTNGFYSDGAYVITEADHRLNNARYPVPHKVRHTQGDTDWLYPEGIQAEPAIIKKTAFNCDFGLGENLALNSTYLTKEQINLGQVDNYSKAYYDGRYTSQAGDYPGLRAMATTKADIGLPDVENLPRDQLDARYVIHNSTSTTLRAQATTKEDVGLSAVDNYAKSAYDLEYAAVNGNYPNLRAQATTKDDIGLGAVDNYSQLDYDNRYVFHEGSYPELRAQGVTASDIGLDLLINEKQATEIQLQTHESLLTSKDTFGHIVAGEGFLLDDGTISVASYPQLQSDLIVLQSPDLAEKIIRVSNEGTLFVEN